MSAVEVARILLALGEGDASVALLAANTLAAHRAQAEHGGWPDAACAETERVQAVAGEIEAQIAQGETLLLGAVHRLEAGHRDHLPQASVLKVQVVRSAITAVQTAVAALGNTALSRHHPLERLLRDVLCARVHPPQEDPALLAAGRRILLDRSW